LLVIITVALAAVAVLAAIVVVAVGGGGELSAEHPDHPPLALPGRRAVGGTDAALLRLPLGLWGYHKQITDEALERFAYELTERDTRIAVLEQELAEARQGTGGGPWDRRRALPAGRGDMPVMGEEPFVTRTDWDPAPRGLPAGREDPFVTRTDGIPTSGAFTSGEPAEAEHAPPTDPWLTISDGPEEETQVKAEEETEAKAEEETEAEADNDVKDDDAEETDTARKDDGE
jgi:hypothetical protein